MYLLNGVEDFDADTRGIGTADNWSSSSCYGIDWTFRGSSGSMDRTISKFYDYS
jgi:hypothetical protein